MMSLDLPPGMLSNTLRRESTRNGAGLSIREDLNRSSGLHHCAPSCAQPLKSQAVRGGKNNPSFEISAFLPVAVRTAEISPHHRQFSNPAVRCDFTPFSFRPLSFGRAKESGHTVPYRIVLDKSEIKSKIKNISAKRSEWCWRRRSQC